MAAVSVNVVRGRCGERGHSSAQCSERNEEQAPGSGASNSTGNEGSLHERNGSGKGHGGNCFVWSADLPEQLSTAVFFLHNTISTTSDNSFCCF